MSGRKLGGGRVLGSGRGLAPPQQHAPSPLHPRPTSPFAPSEASSGSQNLSGISPPTPPSPLPGGFVQDLSSNVSLGAPSGPGASGTRLVCPICEEEMLTLLQLNRHIDDAHQELPEIQQDEVKTWFDKQVLKAKRFQPLSVINQKLRGLEVFESNESPPPPFVAYPSASSSARPAAAAAAAADNIIDPDDLITRKHWQRPTGNDYCTDPACGKGLGPINGSINCRNCGRLFCEVHTMYQMKLSRAAEHDPYRGYWYRVCETCYKSREGYNDHNGVLQDLTEAFVKTRRKKVERQNLEIARLEKRLTRLTQMLVSPPEEVLINSGGGLSTTVASLTGQKSQRKAIEQSVVTWEDDASVIKCPFCQQEFGSWTFRRHHCRICGRVVCADPSTGCSTEVGLNVSSQTTPVPSEKPHTVTAPDGTVSIDIRMCRDCKHTIFAKRDFEAALAHRPPDQRAYETLRQFERGIQQLMPSFQRALQTLQQPPPDFSNSDNSNRLPPHFGSSSNGLAPPPVTTHAQIQEAAKLRKRLMDGFAKYNAAARRIRDLPSENPAQIRLQKAVYAAASTFLHANMVPLKHVPRMLRSSSSGSGVGHRKLLSGLNGGEGGSGGSGSSRAGYLSPLRNGELAESVQDDGGSSVAGESDVSAALEAEEREVRERLAVLEEQRFMVKGMIDGARGARRVEEVGALTRNLEELEGEIEVVRRRVGGVEERWEGVYAGGGPGGGG